MKKLFLSMIIAVLTVLSALSFSGCSCSDGEENNNTVPSSGAENGGKDQIVESLTKDRIRYVLSNDKTYYIVTSGTGIDMSLKLTIPKEVEGKPVKEIGDRAFENYTKLEAVVIPDTVTKIGDFAFYGCNSISGFVIPKSVTRIGEGAFSSCANLQQIEVSKNNTEYKEEKGHLFTKDGKTLVQFSIGRASLEKYAIPEGTRAIASHAFEGAKALKEVTIPLGVENVGACAFFECDGISKVLIPKSVSRIGKRALSGCNSLSEIEVQEGNLIYKSIDGNLYAGSREILIQYAIGKADESFNIPNSVKDIQGYAFYGCTTLKSVSVPKSVSEIGENAFGACTSLTIKCGAKKQPSGWEQSWNPDSCEVEWAE